jgi:hypothetical protein
MLWESEAMVWVRCDESMRGFTWKVWKKEERRADKAHRKY